MAGEKVVFVAGTETCDGKTVVFARLTRVCDGRESHHVARRLSDDLLAAMPKLIDAISAYVFRAEKEAA